ncbi:threonine aldolase 1 [Actinidia rufa]|uniref:Threonine aldolase 1 n=1 Tax=Actinidia rufa TaxID=165716 RepID=A0A7J0G595_9ERIC|nr:threonine aldolase 1 [Actinidia rufa]
MVTRTVDLRSDTVTKPSKAMRAAMANAEVDDDVLGYDPTAFRFEMEMARIMGKEAALYVPSGTMGNLISVLVHCDIRGSEVILGDNSHIHIYENGGISTIGGALGVPVHRLVQAADSVSVCLSKGLGAPVGTVIVGSKVFIAKAKTLRKTLGGGMRQVGVLCAAALVAVQENVSKLEGDHKNAKTFAEGLNKIKGLKVDVTSVETNIVYFDILEGANITSQELCKNVEEHGILLMPERAHPGEIGLGQ